MSVGGKKSLVKFNLELNWHCVTCSEKIRENNKPIFLLPFSLGFLTAQSPLLYLCPAVIWLEIYCRTLSLETREKEREKEIYFSMRCELLKDFFLFRSKIYRLSCYWEWLVKSAERERERWVDLFVHMLHTLTCLRRRRRRLLKIFGSVYKAFKGMI